MTRSIDEWLRGIAGTFVLASVALGYFVHPAFFLFTAFVGVNQWLYVAVGACPASLVLARVTGREAAWCRR